MPRRDDDFGYADSDGRCHDEEGYDITDTIDRRECFSCGGIPSRSAEQLSACNECGEDTCTTCLNRNGVCSSCLTERDFDEQRFPDEVDDDG